MTPIQAQTLNFIRTYIAENGGVSPTFDEISAAIGGRSKGNVSRLVRVLERQGHIRRTPNGKRSIMVLGRIASAAAQVGSVEDRALALLADIIDNPLIVLPGSHPDNGRREGDELRLRHFRPDISEKIAELLDEAGR